jgi:outer membrane lipoprotein-sorting protein
VRHIPRLPLLPYLAALLLALTLTGCATAPPPVPLRAEAEIETLSAAVSLSIQSPAGNMAGRGYLLFRQPDRFRMTLVAPFGMTVADLFSNGEWLTCVIPSRSIAYRGLLADLPQRAGLQGWGMLRWVVERPRPTQPGTGPQTRIARDGTTETVSFDSQGLVQQKRNDQGDLVAYDDYQSVDGVPLPGTITITTRQGEKVRIAFSEPEVNQPLDEAALVPALEGLTVLPLAAFTGF